MPPLLARARRTAPRTLVVVVILATLWYYHEWTLEPVSANAPTWSNGEEALDSRPNAKLEVPFGSPADPVGPPEQQFREVKEEHEKQRPKDAPRPPIKPQRAPPPQLPKPAPARPPARKMEPPAAWKGAGDAGPQPQPARKPPPMMAPQRKEKEKPNAPAKGLPLVPQAADEGNEEDIVEHDAEEGVLDDEDDLGYDNDESEVDAGSNQKPPEKKGKQLKPAGPRRVKDVADIKNAKEVQDAEGWSQRFKKLPGGAADEREVAGANKDPPSPPTAADKEEPLLKHELVARLAAFDFGRDASESGSDDSFQAQEQSNAVAQAADPTVNVTICALIPSEQRFLPEWLLYHRALGVELFSLYDTSAAGAAGGEEVDSLADMLESEGTGEMAPSAQDIKDGLGRASSGLDSKGKVWPDRIQGLERWIEQGIVQYHWMKFKDSKGARSFHEAMLHHCTETFSATSNWILSIDVDEFLVMSDSLLASNEPVRTPEYGWQYPLHELLGSPSIKEAACIPVPQLRYRNVGIRRLAASQGVLRTQTQRDVVKDGSLPEKTMIHTAFSQDFVQFEGPHSCHVDLKAPVPEGLTHDIRNSLGETLQIGGAYKSTRLPTEPLAIAHYFQRDLADCQQKLAPMDDPNDLRTKGRGVVLCEESYLPSMAEMESEDFLKDDENRFLLRVPEEGSVVEDLRVRSSWAARAAHTVLQTWKVKGSPTPKQVEAARGMVYVLNL